MRLSRHAAFFAVAYAFAVTALGTTMPTPLYGIYQEQLGFSELTVTLIYATYAVGVIGGLLLFGRISDQIGRRRTLLPGLALSAASAVVFLLAHGLAPLFLGRILSGLSIGIFTGTATATLVDFAGEGNESRATLASTFANLGGLSLGPLLAGALAEWVGSPLRMPFWLDLAILVPAALVIWAIPEPVEHGGPVQLRPQALHVPAEMRAIFAKAALAAFVGFSVLGSFTGVAGAFLATVLGVDSHFTVGLVVFLVFGSSAVGQLFLGDLDPRAAMRRGCAGLIAGLVLIFAALAAESLAAPHRRRHRRRPRPGPQLPRRPLHRQPGRPGRAPRRGRLELLRRRLHRPLDSRRRHRPPRRPHQPEDRRPRLRRPRRPARRHRPVSLAREEDTSVTD